MTPSTDSELEVPPQETSPKRRARSSPSLDARMGLSDLVDLPSLRDVMAAFAELYRVGIKIYDVPGNKLVDVRVGNGKMCGHLWEFDSTKKACADVVRGLKQGPFMLEPGHGDARHSRWQVQLVTCFTGLRYVVAPLVYEDDLMGRIVFGPYTPHDAVVPDETLYQIEPKLDRSTTRPSRRALSVARAHL